MAERFRVLTGLAYPTDPTIDEALREFGRQATDAAHRAAATQDPRDIDAATTAEAARAAAVAAAFESGALVERVPGDVVEDIPAQSVPWLLEQGHVVAMPIDEATWQDLGWPADDPAVDEPPAKPNVKRARAAKPATLAPVVDAPAHTDAAATHEG